MASCGRMVIEEWDGRIYHWGWGAVGSGGTCVGRVTLVAMVVQVIGGSAAMHLGWRKCMSLREGVLAGVRGGRGMREICLRVLVVARWAC